MASKMALIGHGFMVFPPGRFVVCPWRFRFRSVAGPLDGHLADESYDLSQGKGHGEEHDHRLLQGRLRTRLGGQRSTCSGGWFPTP